MPTEDHERAAINQQNQAAWELRNTDPHGMLTASRATHLDATRLRYRTGIAHSLGNVLVAYNRLGLYPDALATSIDALAAFEDLPSSLEKARALYYTGWAYASVGLYPDALRWYLDALDICHDIDHLECTSQVQSAIGVLRAEMSEFDDALQDFQQCLMIARQTNNAYGEATFTLNIGEVCLRTRDLIQARQYTERALAIFHELGETSGEGKAHNNLADILRQLKDTEQAEMHAKQSLVIARGSKDRFGQVMALSLLGQLKLDRDDPDTAREHFLRALDIAESIESQRSQYELHHHLYTLHRDLGDFKTALYHHERFHDLKERVFSTDSDTRYHALLAAHAAETAAMEAAFYHQKAEELEEEVAKRGALIADLDAYAHTVAHDLKNPTMVISGYLQILQSDLESREGFDEQQRYIDAAIEHTHNLEAIINDLLLLARVRQKPVSPMPVDVRLALQKALQRLQHTVEESGVQIDLPDGMPRVMGFAPWIEAIWVNYISNAIKYGGDPPCITVRYQWVEGTRVCYTVQDNGDGLSAEQLKQVFAPFKRVTTDEAIPGHGLGLSIVKRIAERLGGEVTVSSRHKPGKGAVFSFTLPGVPSDEPTQPHRPADV